MASAPLEGGALELVEFQGTGEGRSFTSLGLREIAREAGLVPNAFYRHFRNTDELGLVLVEEVGITLRRLLREARKMDVAPRDMLAVAKAYLLEAQARVGPERGVAPRGPTRRSHMLP